MKTLCLFVFTLVAGCFIANAQCPPGDVSFLEQAEVDAFRIRFPGCTQISGNLLVVKSRQINNLDGLRGITVVAGNVRIVENRSLLNLRGLAGLRSVGGNLTVAGNHSLSNLRGLEAVETVGDNLAIDDNASLTYADALENLRSVGGRFGFYNSALLEKLNGFNRLKSVGSYLDVQNCDALREINGFASLETAGGIWLLDNQLLQSVAGFNSMTAVTDNIDIRNNKSLEKITGFKKTATIGNHLVIDNNDQLTDLSGFLGLRKTGKSIDLLGLEKLRDASGLNGVILAGGLEIRDNPSLESLAGLNGLTALTGLLQLVNNPKLSDLTALGGIRSIKTQLQIVDNRSLTTLAGLDQIDYTTIEKMTITGNGSLSVCGVSSICDFLNFGGNASLFGNSTGCNNKMEVISSSSACAPNFTSRSRSLWKTMQGRWLLGLLALAICGAIASWFFYRKRQRSRLLKLRIKLAEDLHDDLGSEISGMALASFAAARSGDPARMAAALENLATQSQKLVDDMRDIVWSLHPDNDSLEKMVSRMRQYASKMLNEEVSLRFEVAADALPVKMEAEARKQLYLFFKEAVNNLARHADCTKVRIDIRRENSLPRQLGGQFLLEINDNGAGFDLSAARSSGNGLRNLRHRAAALNGSLDIQSLLGEGTTVRLRAPLS